MADDSEGSQAGQVVLGFEDFWDAALEAKKEKDIEKAANLFYTIHKRFPADERSHEALFRAAMLKKQLARDGSGDWADVKDIFREYISFYPKSKHISSAYYEVGTAFFQMRFLRESLSYYKLFVKLFPGHELASQAEVWQAKILSDIGRLAESEKKFKELTKHEKAQIRKRARVGLAEIFNIKKQYYSSLKIFHDLASVDPNFFLDVPIALQVFGYANLEVGNVERGRRQLIHYLNLADAYVSRADVLFRIGESYWKEKRYNVAKKMYQRSIAEGKEGRRPLVFSEMRIAQYFDDPKRVPSKWEKKYPLTDPTGDKPYLAVLDLFYKDPLAQAARAGMFWRSVARDDLKGIHDYGKNYLRIARLQEMDEEEKELAGNILMELIEKLFAAEKYQELYDIYFSEHKHVKEFPNGRLLYLVGQAMEALSMFDQAAVIYYRAMKWPLSNKDKVDLYFRRASIYLLKGDLESAERLLTYLRKLYKGKKEFGEVLWYSGRLREAQKRPDDALLFYSQVKDFFMLPHKKADYVSDVVNLMVKLRDPEILGEFNRFKEQEWVPVEQLQQLYVKAADSFRAKQDCNTAIGLYKGAIENDLPKDNSVFQAANLYLGDCLYLESAGDEGRGYYEEASTGKDSLLKQMASERLNQKDIEQELTRLQ